MRLDYCHSFWLKRDFKGFRWDKLVWYRIWYGKCSGRWLLLWRLPEAGQVLGRDCVLCTEHCCGYRWCCCQWLISWREVSQFTCSYMNCSFDSLLIKKLLSVQAPDQREPPVCLTGLRPHGLGFWSGLELQPVGRKPTEKPQRKNNRASDNPLSCCCSLSTTTQSDQNKQAGPLRMDGLKVFITNAKLCVHWWILSNQTTSPPWFRFLSSSTNDSSEVIGFCWDSGIWSCSHQSTRKLICHSSDNQLRVFNVWEFRRGNESVLQTVGQTEQQILDVGLWEIITGFLQNKLFWSRQGNRSVRYAHHAVR